MSKQHKTKMTVYLDQQLVDIIDRMSERKEKSRNAVVSTLLEDYIGQLRDWSINVEGEDL